MSNIFQSLSGRAPQKSSFNLSHARKFSFAPGQCYPILCQDTMPGDRWSYDASALVRLMPTIAPVMHLIDVCVYSFNVPLRLTMERSKWEVFITGGVNGDGRDAQGTLVQIPFAYFKVAGPFNASGLSAANLAPGTLADYLGLGVASASGPSVIRFNMQPFIAFWRIWCEYFRDQTLHPDYANLYPGIFNSTGDITGAIHDAMTVGDDLMAFFTVPQVCWEKDYFTSSLITAQRGAAVETPLTGTGTVSYLSSTQIKKSDGTKSANGPLNATDFGPPGYDNPSVTGDAGNPLRFENIDEVNVSSGGFTINALRLAYRLQEWLEKMQRGGSRYIEQTKSIFGVVSSDARLQRAEYLAGGKIPVHISEVLQTGENGVTPLGEMAGHGVAAGKVTGWSKFFEEHSMIITVMFMRPKTAYQQGVPRLYTHRFDKLDWPWPSFAHLGEQEVKTSEIFLTWDADQNDETFGYQQRYAEYKYIPSSVHGEFKNTLDFWHWGRIFQTTPTLSAEFVSCDPDPRIFNVIQSTDPCYCIVTNRINCVRPLPYYGEPSL